MPQHEELIIYRNRLPHWRLFGSAYFITWDMLPERNDLSPAERTIVADCLKHFHHQRYRLYGFVVMNDHVHVLASPLDGFEITNAMHTWKSFTAHEINKARGEHGHLWRKDSYDRIMRDEAEFIEKLEYIVTNPSRRWPEIASYEWVEWFPWVD